jgi:hypothetical protein
LDTIRLAILPGSMRDSIRDAEDFSDVDRQRLERLFARESPADRFGGVIRQLAGVGLARHGERDLDARLHELARRGVARLVREVLSRRQHQHLQHDHRDALLLEESRGPHRFAAGRGDHEPDADTIRECDRVADLHFGGHARD